MYGYNNSIIYNRDADMDWDNERVKNKEKNDNFTAEEREVYLAYIREKYPNIDPDTVTMEPDGDYVNLSFKKPRKVVAKMGGTLIGDPDTWNEAKRAEYYENLPNPLE